MFRCWYLFIEVNEMLTVYPHKQEVFMYAESHGTTALFYVDMPSCLVVHNCLW